VETPVFDKSETLKLAEEKGKRMFMKINMLKWAFVAVAAVSSDLSQAQTQDDMVGRWLLNQESIAKVKLFNNISRPDTRRGVVVASPQRHNPDYYFLWIRDAALVMNSVLGLYKNTDDQNSLREYRRRLYDYVDISEENQFTRTITGLGEPKFLVDGLAFNDPWGRPQNDGPALRAITLIGFAKILLNEGQADYVRERLYTSRMPANTIIKKDLEYVAHHWAESSFDLWEEVRGTHFYTRMAQRRALRDGADLAELMGDGGAAQFYLQQAREIERELNRHYRAEQGLVVETLDTERDIHRESAMDSAVILAALHSGIHDDAFSISSEPILSSLHLMTERFKTEYAINQRPEFTGVAIGRYPEDVYSGTQSPYGNPWVLSTMGFAEALYKAAQTFQLKHEIPVRRHTEALFNTALLLSGSSLRVQSGELLQLGEEKFKETLRSLILYADSFVMRVKTHANPDGSLSEQIDRYTGFMTSAGDLTWNYASVLTAAEARQKLLKATPWLGSSHRVIRKGSVQRNLGLGAER